MKTVGLICEYNPFHLGHLHQLQAIREKLGADTRIVCLMSGNFVQRGEPAVFDKSTRAAAAARCGADLVLELPPVGALSSAEGFARCGVKTLADLGICDCLAFGSETGGRDPIAAAEAMADFRAEELLRAGLAEGLTYGAAKQRALAKLTGIADILSRPNDILAAEYCRFLRQTDISPLPILRQGDDRSRTLSGIGTSAGAIRTRLFRGDDWLSMIPRPAQSLFAGAAPHSLAAGEKAVLARLYGMTDSDWQAAAHNGEGLHNKIIRAAAEGCSLSEIAAAAKSRRYPATRISRLILCAALGITGRELQSEPPYLRILAFGKNGRELVRKAKKHGSLPLLNPTEKAPDCAFSALEARVELYYHLFEHKIK